MGAPCTAIGVVAHHLGCAAVRGEEGREEEKTQRMYICTCHLRVRMPAHVR